MSAFDILTDDSGPLLLVIIIGLFEGSFIGSMATVVPMQVTILAAMLVSLMVWRSTKISFFAFFIMLGSVFGGAFGALGGTIPWGLSIFFIIQIVVYFWRTGASGAGGSLPSLIAIPFFIFISVGLFYNFAYADFCFQYFDPSGNIVAYATAVHADVCQNPSGWVHGFPTIYAGCLTDCVLSPLSLFGSSIFSNFINSAAQGDYVGMLSAFFPGPQSGIGSILGFITAILTFTVGIILLLIGLGIGFSASVIASGFGITINEAGTRMAQSMGIGLILWSIIFASFGGWFSAFGTGLSWGGILSTTIVVFFATMVFYGFYTQGKNIGGTSG